MKQETKVIKEYLKKIGASFVRVRSVKHNTNCDMGNNIIYFNRKDFQNENFNNIVRDYYNSIGQNDIKVSMETYAVLHELGHILSKMEIENLDESVNNYLQQQTELKDTDNQKQNFFDYRNLPLEKLADKYAYIVYKNFEKQSIKFDKKLQQVAE
jgi:hypothetical protein